MPALNRRLSWNKLFGAKQQVSTPNAQPSKSRDDDKRKVVYLRSGRSHKFVEFSDFVIINYLIAPTQFEGKWDSKDSIEKLLDTEVPNVMKWLVSMEKLRPQVRELDNLKTQLIQKQMAAGSKRFAEYVATQDQDESNGFLHVRYKPAMTPPEAISMSEHEVRDLVLKKLALHLAYYRDQDFVAIFDETLTTLATEPINSFADIDERELSVQSRGEHVGKDHYVVQMNIPSFPHRLFLTKECPSLRTTEQISAQIWNKMCASAVLLPKEIAVQLARQAMTSGVKGCTFEAIPFTTELLLGDANT